MMPCCGRLRDIARAYQLRPKRPPRLLGRVPYPTRDCGPHTRHRFGECQRDADCGGHRARGHRQRAVRVSVMRMILMRGASHGELSQLIELQGAG